MMKKEVEGVSSQYSLCICMNLIKFNLQEMVEKLDVFMSTSNLTERQYTNYLIYDNVKIKLK